MPDAFDVGNVRIQPDRLRLERDGQVVPVEPKVMEALLCLAATPGRTVSRDALMAAVWPDVHVSDDALNRCIWKLRRALGDESGAPRFLATVPKRGYRLVAPVTPVHPLTTSRDDAGRRAPAAVLAWPRLVLPLALSLVVLALIAVARANVDERTTTSSVPWFAHARAIEPLTSLDGYESGPSFSPDGRQVAFHYYRRDGSEPGQFDLMLLDVGSGGAPSPIADTPADEVLPAWSPDGRRLAYRRQDDSGCAVVIVTMATRDERVAGACDRDVWSPMAWLPGGAALVIASRGLNDGPSRLVRVGLDDGSETVLTSPHGLADGDSAPAVSPDGRWLAFVRAQSGDVRDVFVADLDGSSPRPVTREHGRLGGFAWSDDSRHIVFASDRLGPFRLWSISLDGGSPAAILTVGVNASTPAISGVGPTLVYEEWDSTIDVRRVRLAGAEDPPATAYSATSLVTSTRWDSEARWSPDGSRLAFLSDRLGATDVWVATADGSDPRRLTDLGTRFASWLRWSPDGRQVAFSAPVDGQLEIFLLDVEAGRAARVVRDESDERWPAWSPDGRWLYFGSNRSGRWEIWRQPTGSGPAEAVTHQGGLAPALSVDGSLYFVKADAPGLWRASAAGAGETLVLDTLAPRQTSWDLGDHAVYVAETAPGGPVALVRHDLRGGAPRVVALFESPAGGYPEWFSGSGVSISPDGREVAFSSVERSGSDLWIVR